jgi:hypothetical protein
MMVFRFVFGGVGAGPSIDAVHFGILAGGGHVVKPYL